MNSRIEREREFHDGRFTKDWRQNAQKYYVITERLFDEFRKTVEEGAEAAHILEIGCAKGDNILRLAANAREAVGIDISSVAVEQARQRASELGLSNTRFEVMDAEQLAFEDQYFDVVFGSGIIHHVDVDRIYSEMRRVLRTGGLAIFIEPLGHNPLINAYRALTPKLRTEDEHPLLIRDVRRAQAYFSHVQVSYYYFTALMSVPLRRSRFFRGMLSVLDWLDQIIFRIPGLSKNAWFVRMVLTK